MFPKKRLKKYAYWILSLLTILFLIIQLTNGLIWRLDDFLKIAIVLISVFISIEISIQILTKKSHRVIFVIVAILLILAIWAELQGNFFSESF